MESNHENQITLKITKGDPKPDAPRYEFRTIPEMFAAITPENVDRFLADFDAGFRMAVLLRAAVSGIADAAGQESGNDLMQMNSFVWIDD